MSVQVPVLRCTAVVEAYSTNNEVVKKDSYKQVFYVTYIHIFKFVFFIIVIFILVFNVFLLLLLLLLFWSSLLYCHHYFHYYCYKSILIVLRTIIISSPVQAMLSLNRNEFSEIVLCVSILEKNIERNRLDDFISKLPELKTLELGITRSVLDLLFLLILSLYQGNCLKLGT